MKRIICFGDSNTYGYDPRSFLGGRYPREVRWVDRLGKATGMDFVNLGLNGRCIPGSAGAVRDALGSIGGSLGAGGDDELWIMLGSNDLLMLSQATVEKVAARMGRFVRAVQESDLVRKGSLDIRLIAPPGMVLGEWCPNEATRQASLGLGAAYRNLAQNLDVRFIDLSGEKFPLCADGVHLTEEGHQLMAEKLAAYLREERKE